MIRFPIYFIIPNRYSEFHLNDEWTVECNWFRHEGLKLSVAIRNRREITSEEIPISGVLSVSKRNGPVLERFEFSKFMKRSQRRDLVELLVGPKLSNSSSYMKEFCKLHGDIIIACNRDKCEKCIQTKSLVQLSNDFERLLDPQTSSLADMNLICCNVSIPAHKIILSARSPVFAAMFKNPMKENLENQVDITDIDASVLQTMVFYIYTGKVSDLTITSATDLLFAADKYIIQDLKEVCCDFLKNNVTLQHVLKTLVRGDILPECLKSLAMDYISNKCADFSSIENTEEWKALKNESPALAMEILESFVKSKDKK
ncbi:TD and POZ domain-containing protein 3 [Araneus ventricosus]|uniref:TD and POZ domain-containing protein 3 n=1 Tax=Araneus ventricosus TaxID=182803 RepID=A0A4Y2M8F7_ARAVE|nr:TD and POZ domain-containing protein 3 [Araneus ventricosus]